MTESTSDIALRKILESIENRLGGIETKLENVIRLEERVSNHEHVISRYGRRLDEGDHRIRSIELWQAEHNPDLIITTLKSNQDTIETVKEELKDIKATGNVNKGHKDIGKEILRWVASILAAYVIWKATKGF